MLSDSGAGVYGACTACHVKWMYSFCATGLRAMCEMVRSA